MHGESLTFIFLNAAVINNFVLAMFLGICPFLGVSGKLKTAASMGAATTLVIVMSSACAYALNFLLVHFQLEFLRLISYIVVIASAVQLVEMAMKKFCSRPPAATISLSRSPSAAVPAWASPSP
jgi:electron transport complex protein RnfA